MHGACAPHSEDVVFWEGRCDCGDAICDPKRLKDVPGKQKRQIEWPALPFSSRKTCRSGVQKHKSARSSDMPITYRSPPLAKRRQASLGNTPCATKADTDLQPRAWKEVQGGALSESTPCRDFLFVLTPLQTKKSTTLARSRRRTRR